MTESTTTKRTSKVKGKRQLNIYIIPETHAVLAAIQKRDGVPFSAQVDRAVRLWAEHKGIEVPHAEGADGGPR